MVRQKDATESFRGASRIDSFFHTKPTSALEMLGEMTRQILRVLYGPVADQIECKTEYDQTDKEYVLELLPKHIPDLNNNHKAKKIIAEYISELEKISSDECEVESGSFEIFAKTKLDLYVLLCAHLKARDCSVLNIYTSDRILPRDHDGETSPQTKAVQKYFANAQILATENPEHIENILWFTPMRVYGDYETCIATSEFMAEKFKSLIHWLTLSEYAALTEEKIKLEEFKDPKVKRYITPDYILN